MIEEAETREGTLEGRRRLDCAFLFWRSGSWQSVLILLLLPALSLPSALALPPGEPAVLEASSRVPSRGELLREFTDPCLGTHWQLLADPVHPEGPRRLVLLEPVGSRRSGRGDDVATARLGTVANVNAPPRGEGDLPNLAPPLAIRAGDRVTVDQETPLLHARLQAVALESAGVGQRMRVRLGAGTIPQSSLSATVIAVLVTGTGQAKW